MLINKTNIAGLAVASALWSQIAPADTVEVKAVVTKFEPTVLFIKPGDSVKFTNMAGHDTVAIEGMIPDGAEPWKSAMNEEFSVTLDKEGAYVYKCTPHVGNGMMGAIVVGELPPQSPTLQMFPNDRVVRVNQARTSPPTLSMAPAHSAFSSGRDPRSRLSRSRIRAAPSRSRYAWAPGLPVTATTS